MLFIRHGAVFSPTRAVGYVIGICCIMLSFCAVAQADTGKVIDILEGSVTVQLDGKNIFQKGDQVDLSYMAGVIEMLIGTYEVSHAQDNVFIAKEISLTMPPNKGMKVKVVKKENVLQIFDVGAMEQPDTDPRFIQEREGFSNNEPLPEIVFNQAAEEEGVEIQGEVIEVMGQDVKIKLTSEGQARVGFSADLTFVTSQGTALPVGTWTVKSVDGQTVVAAPTVDAANPRVGLKALISNKKTEDKKRSMPVKNPGPDIFAEDYDFNIDGPPQGTNLFGKQNAAQEKSNFLLGIEKSPFMTGEAPLFEDTLGAQQDFLYPKGNPHATVTITAFVDFEDQFSRRFYLKILKMIQPYLKDARFVLRHYPLPMHPNARLAAKACYAAGEQGKYWEMAEALFASKDILSQKRIKKLAKKMGLNVKRFSADLVQKDARWEQLIQQDMALAQQWNLTGVPSYYINGQRVDHANLTQFLQELDKALEAKDFSFSGVFGEKPMGEQPGPWKKVTFEGYKRDLIAQQGTDGQIEARRAGSLAAPNNHWLGVAIKENDSLVGQAYATAPVGIRVAGVYRDSPAEAAGLEVADLIYKANGQELTSVQQFVDIIHIAPNGVLDIEMQRDTQMMQKRIQLQKNRFPR
jgi:hypothetical protein